MPLTRQGAATPDDEYEVDLRFGELLRFQFYLIVVRMKGGWLLVLYLVVAAYMASQVVTGQVSLSASAKAFAIVFGLPLFLVVVTVVGTYQQYDRVRSWGGLLLLFLNRHHALIIPRRCLGERDAEIREYIASKLRRAV